MGTHWLARLAFFLVLVIAIGVTGSSVLGASSPALQPDRSGTGWASFDGAVSPQTNLFRVFMLDTNNAWASGDTVTGTQVAFRVFKLEYRGGRWMASYTHDFARRVIDIVAASDDAVWVVGDDGLFMRKGADGWHDVPTPYTGNPKSLFTTIQMFGKGEEGWVAGGVAHAPDENVPPENFLLHYKNGAWQPDPTMTGPRGVNRLHFAQGGGWAIGSSNVWRYTGGGWVDEPLPPCPPTISWCGVLLHSVRAVNAAEAWAVGEIVSTSLPSGQLALILHRVNGKWEQVLPGEAISSDPYVSTRIGSVLFDVSFNSEHDGLAVGAQIIAQPGGARPLAQPLVLRLRDDGRWHYEDTPAFPKPDGAGLSSVSQADQAHAIAVGNQGFVVGYGYPGSTVAPTPTPTQPAVSLPTGRVPDPHASGVLYFGLVGHTLRGELRDYWQNHGALA